MNKVIFIMGVCGVGKSTIGELLSAELKIPYFDGDDFHSEDNVLKMSEGQPLTDEDRQPWLLSINEFAAKQSNKKGCIIACSALKQRYRTTLTKGIEKVCTWVHLQGSFGLILERMNKRANHFMSSDLLQSQLDTLENPKNAIKVDISLSPQEAIQLITNNMINKSEFGLFGLGVMGKSLSRNLARNGFNISLFNRHVPGLEEDVAVNFQKKHHELSHALPFDGIAGFVNSIETPRKIMLMVNAGKILDMVIEDLIPHLSDGDILIDGGNSNYKTTNAKADYLKSKHINFIGVGVSGGEEGALKGPSIMPGGNKDAYEAVSPFLSAIAAKDDHGLPCCTYIGPEGSGHFVKMVHNGIEYAEMQLLCDVYGIQRAMGKTQDQIADMMDAWPESVNSYLLEITIDILRKKEGDQYLLEKIVDKAGNKGTGNWTTIAMAELGVPSTMIASALFARYTSFFKEDRVTLDKIYGGDTPKPELSSEEILDAYSFCRIVNHYQGLRLIGEASKNHKWELNLSEIARVWTNGCIIRSTFVKALVEILAESDNMLTHPVVIEMIKKMRPSANKVISQALRCGIAIPCLSEAANFFNALSSGQSTANLIQAQRDFFGAHTYQRTDDDSGSFHHTQWV